MHERIINETQLDLRMMMPLRHPLPTGDISDAVEHGIYRIRPGTVVRLLHHLPPQGNGRC